jgi:hypothetical protein
MASINNKVVRTYLKQIALNSGCSGGILTSFGYFGAVYSVHYFYDHLYCPINAQMHAMRYKL